MQDISAAHCKLIGLEKGAVGQAITCPEYGGQPTTQHETRPMAASSKGLVSLGGQHVVQFNSYRLLAVQICPTSRNVLTKLLAFVLLVKSETDAIHAMPLILGVVELLSFEDMA